MPDDESDPDGSFDAVFSNAARHWIPGEDHDGVLSMVGSALGDSRRFVAELGGRGNVSRVEAAMRAGLDARGDDSDHSWYFPSTGEYAPRLAAHGLGPTSMRLFARPTEPDGGESGLCEWVGMFGGELLERVSEIDREAILDGIEQRLRPALYDAEATTWTVEYRRLRFVAEKV